MAGSSKDTPRRKSSAKRAGSSGKDAAEHDVDWTKGLKKLYDSVVEEPLPDSFRDLLGKLDAED